MSNMFLEFKEKYSSYSFYTIGIKRYVCTHDYNNEEKNYSKF